MSLMYKVLPHNKRTMAHGPLIGGLSPEKKRLKLVN